MTTARARDFGLEFDGQPGRFNAITDVPGVEVGYETLLEGEATRTGVTAILPLGREGVGSSCPAGWYSLNGNGEMTGTAWVDEIGALTLPIGITSSNSVGMVHRGIIDWVVRERPELDGRWLLPVVGETWDGYLNDLNAPSITPQTAVQALDNATAGPIAEGSVGGGTGMNLYGFKGGTGTSSRRVDIRGTQYTVGCIMQANFGARHELTIRGHQVGRELLDDNPLYEHALAMSGAGSCITIIATDAPLLPGQCTALARRVPLGLARGGTTGSHYSGDLFLAFSATNAGALDSGATEPTDATPRNLEFLAWGHMDALYEAVVQAVEETVVNVLAASRTMTGQDGRRIPGFPVDVLGQLAGRKNLQR